LAKLWGKSPKDYFYYRVEVTSDNSVLKLFAEEVVPKALAGVRSVAPSKFFIIITGGFVMTSSRVISTKTTN
jgi:hypothetical protein